MLQGSIRRETLKRQELNLRGRRDLRKIACDQVKIGYGPVEVPHRPYRDKDDKLVEPEATDFVAIAKPEKGCVVFTTVPATWEIVDNRDAIIRQA